MADDPTEGEGEDLFPSPEDGDGSDDDDTYYEDDPDDDGPEMDYAAAELFFTLPHWGAEAMRNMLQFRPDEYAGLESPVDYFNDIHSAVLERLESARAYAETVIPADLDPATRAGQVNMMVLGEQSAITSEIVYLPGRDDDDDDHFGTDFDVLATYLYRTSGVLPPIDDEDAEVDDDDDDDD